MEHKAFASDTAEKYDIAALTVYAVDMDSNVWRVIDTLTGEVLCQDTFRACFAWIAEHTN